MSSSCPDAGDMSVALTAEAYLAELRAALESELRGPLLEELRGGIDEWCFEGVDPFEPLTNRGRRVVPWDAGDWCEICSDLCGRLERILEADDPALPLERLPADLAGYAGHLAVELNAREGGGGLARSPDETVLLPLLVAARKGAEPALFRRYLIGVFDRREAFEQRVFGFDRVVDVAAIGAALGSADDRAVGPRVREIRDWLTRGAASGERRFRDAIRPRLRPRWRAVAEASAVDAAAWAATFMG